MELTGSPSFTVHDSCTHERAPDAVDGDVALMVCADAPEVVGWARSIVNTTAQPRRAIIRDKL